MSRVKRGTTHTKRRRNILKQAKGFKWGRKNKLKLAQTAITKAGVHAYRGRKVKKRVNSALWNIRINAAVRPHDLSYSRFMAGLKSQGIVVNRKVLSELANDHPAIFEKLIETVKK